MPSDSLLESPCSQVEYFKTPRELGNLQLMNVACIKKFETALQTLRDWKREKQKLYDVAE